MVDGGWIAHTPGRGDPASGMVGKSVGARSSRRAMSLEEAWMGWRTVVDMASLLGGVFALIAMWLYLKPTVIVTIETYEYVPGTGNRRFRLVVRNTGNVPVRLLRFDQEFQDNTPPGSWTDLSPMFVGRDGRTWRDQIGRA